MRRTSLLVSVLGLLGLTLSQIVDINSELICSPSDPTDCYPKIFVPTDEWQDIREGQDIPPGLHVRLNIDTLVKEAKIYDPREDEDSTQEQALVISEQPEEEEQETVQVNKPRIAAKAAPALEAEISRKIQEHKQQQANMQEQFKKTRITSGDLKEYDSAVEEIKFIDHDADAKRISVALETLEELSHDIEFGAKLTQDASIFQDLLNLQSKLGESNESLQDQAYRVMASALRNNPEAIDNVLSNQSTEFVDTLFQRLTSTNSDVLQKRILGVIHALTQNEHFIAKYFNNHNNNQIQQNNGLNQLISAFPKLGSQAQTRLINIFEDLNLVNTEVKNSNQKRDIEDSANPEKQYSDFLQSQLAEGKTQSETQFRLYFNKLSEVHQENKSLEPSKEFVAWLAKEAEERAKNTDGKRDLSNYTDEDAQFDRSMLEARHIVFGNPMAMRKAIADEL